MSLLASWLASPPPDAAVEIAPERVSAAVVSSRGDRPAVTAHASEALPAGAVVPSLVATNIAEPGPVSEAMRRVFDRLGTRPRRVALVIPDTTTRISLVRFEQVPARRDDLDQLIRWQLRKAAPFPIDEACVSYTKAARSDAGGTDFVVGMARREVVREYEGVCEAAGAYAGLVDLATLSLINLVLGAPPVASGDWLLVHVRPEYTAIAIMRGEDMIFYRSRLEGDESSLADLVHQSAMYYQDRLSGKGFTRVLLGGAGALDVARRSLEERLGVPVDSIDPTRAATLTDRITASGDLVDVLGPLVGMLMRARAETVRA
jgi:type IV pilus assembly protein PilM